MRPIHASKRSESSCRPKLPPPTRIGPKLTWIGCLASDLAQPHQSAALPTTFLSLMRPRASQTIVRARALSCAD
eukprot:206070-Chlamydomonas_euryale.AAC.2